MNIECEHGQLKRSCNICELELEVLELNRQLLLAENVIDKLKPYSVNDRKMVDSYYKFRVGKKVSNDNE